MKFFTTIFAFLESIGRARAAAHLVRIGEFEKAQTILKS